MHVLSVDDPQNPGYLVVVSCGGDIRLADGFALNYETFDELSITVQATDGHGGSADVNVVINITDVDEPPSAIPASYGSGWTISEAHPVHTPTGHSFGCSDDGGNANDCSFSIYGGADGGGRFHVDPATGELVLVDSLDFETGSMYSLRVQVTGRGHFSSFPLASPTRGCFS